MSHITEHNYEAYYLDYMEGNLGAEDTAQLLLFLEKNPSIKEELEGFELIELTPDNNINLDKTSLHQSINDDNVEDYIIASLENVIEPTDKKDLDTFLSQSPESQQLAARYQKTILPTPTVLYPNKEELKEKRRVLLYYLTPLVGTAAALLIFFLFHSGTKNDSVSENIHLSETPDTNTLQTSEQKTTIAIEQTPNTTENSDDDVIIITEKQSIKNESQLAIKDRTPINNNQVTPNETSPELNKDEQQATNETIAISEQRETIDHVVKDSLDIHQLAIVSADTGRVEDEQEEEPDQLVENKITEEPTVARTTPDHLTIGQWINKTIRKKVFKQQNPGAEKIKREEILSSVAEKIGNSRKTYNEKEDVKTSTFSISIGNFGFSRTRTKK